VGGSSSPSIKDFSQAEKPAMKQEPPWRGRPANNKKEAA